VSEYVRGLQLRKGGGDHPHRAPQGSRNYSIVEVDYMNLKREIRADRKQD
jgi:hypothetical protein